MSPVRHHCCNLRYTSVMPVSGGSPRLPGARTCSQEEPSAVMPGPKKRGPHDPPFPFVVRYKDEARYRRRVAKYGEAAAQSAPEWFSVSRDFVSLVRARRFARRVSGATIKRRVNLYDDTPNEVTWETRWRWDEETVDE